MNWINRMEGYLRGMYALKVPKCQQLLAEWGHKIAEDSNNDQNLMQKGPQFMVYLS